VRHSDSIRAKIELVLPASRAVAGQLWSSPELGRLYPAYLCVVHGMIRASVPLMQAALGEAERRSGTDPTARALVPYLRKHIPEERGHDEWVRQDLAAIGMDPDLPWARMPSPALAALVGAQYYWLYHHHPVSLLGYIAVLEGYPPKPELADLIMASTGFPKTGLRTLLRHSTIDQRHRDELMSAIDALPLEPAQLGAISLSGMYTVSALVPVFEEVLATREQTVPGPPAGNTAAPIAG
jgi:Iron-containing redox enzyme